MKSIQNIPAGEFKAKCLKLMQEVTETHRPLIITKHGKPLVQIIPLDDAAPKSYFGCMKGTVQIKEDITKPLDIEWDVNAD